MTYFNENDGYPAQWLRNLWPDAVVDERSIADVESVEADRAHLFAGIGGWELALDLAGWPADRPIWTGSCPCQPFSVAGKGRGTADERHLWPEFFRLIRQHRPPTVVGEQVASKAGRDWLAGVFADLESVGYAVAGADLCAAGVGAPHIRQRLWWVAHAHLGQRDGIAGGQGRECDGAQAGWQQGDGEPERRGASGRVGVAHVAGLQGRGLRSEQVPGQGAPWADESVLLLCADGKARRTESGLCPLAHGVPRRASKLRAYGNAIVPQVAAEFLRAVLESTP